MISVDRIAPVFPVRSVRAALEHYRKLGFEAKAYGELDASGGDAVYGFVNRGAIEIHLTRTPELDCEETTSACYIYVGDADALHREWTKSGAGGRFTDPQD